MMRLGTSGAKPHQDHNACLAALTRCFTVLAIAVLCPALPAQTPAPSPASPGPRADQIFTHANVYTGVPSNTPFSSILREEAIAVRADRIQAVGKTADILKLKGPQTQVIDLGGHFVMPGFNDAHVHLADAGLKKLTVDLTGVKSLDEFRNRTLNEEEHRRAREWIGKLNDVSPEVRAKAAENLIGMGPRVASLLRQTIERREANTSDRGTARLIQSARQCLETIEGDSAIPMPESAPRLLALRRPAGTVEAILARVSIPVQLGGGIRDLRAIAADHQCVAGDDQRRGQTRRSRQRSRQDPLPGKSRDFAVASSGEKTREKFAICSVSRSPRWYLASSG